MRITVDIDERILKELQSITQERKMSPAVSKAVTEYVKRSKAREFGRMLREGVFDYEVTNEEIESRDK